MCDVIKKTCWKEHLFGASSSEWVGWTVKVLQTHFSQLVLTEVFPTGKQAHLGTLEHPFLAQTQHGCPLIHSPGVPFPKCAVLQSFLEECCPHARPLDSPWVLHAFPSLDFCHFRRCFANALSAHRAFGDCMPFLPGGATDRWLINVAQSAHSQEGLWRHCGFKIKPMTGDKAGNDSRVSAVGDWGNVVRSLPCLVQLRRNNIKGGRGSAPKSLVIFCVCSAPVQSCGAIKGPPHPLPVFNRGQGILHRTLVAPSDSLVIDNPYLGPSILKYTHTFSGKDGSMHHEICHGPILCAQILHLVLAYEDHIGWYTKVSHSG